MSSCCLALIIVLILLIGGLAAGRQYIKNKIYEAGNIEGLLPGVKAITTDLDYGDYLPVDLPSLDFDPELAAFTVRTCASALNRGLGANPLLPKGLVEVGWVAGHTLMLKVVPSKSATGKDLFVIAIAGTNTYSDVRDDLKGQLVDFYGVGARAGFVDAFQQSYPAIREMAGANPNAQFIVAGHSLGAAVATLVAIGLGADFPGISVALYASATPRTGTRSLIGLLNRVAPNHWHIANRADVIPTFPLSVSPLMGDGGVKSLYASFDRIAIFETQSGTLTNNHNTHSYLCGIEGGKACSQSSYTTPLRAVSFI
jgi:hypothetical protein